MQYQDYEVSDFLQDEYFLQWVLDPNPEATHFWQAWLASHPEKSQTVREARQLVEQMHYGQEFILSPQRYTTMLENILRYQRQLAGNKSHIRENRVKTIWWSVAASLLLAAFGLGIFQYRQTIQNPKASVITNVTKETSAGVKTTITLPDGSLVKLNAESKIQYPAQFGTEKREVFLSGEAFFEVEKDTSRPFIIRSESVETLVLGTAFNVRAYRNENNIKVAVLRGLVRVSDQEGDTFSLKPSIMAVYDKTNETLAKHSFDSIRETGWKDGILYFKEDPLKEVFKRLESWYGVQIQVQPDFNQMLEERYSGEYRHETLNNVLEGISFTADFQYNLEGKQITIYKAKSQPS